MNDMSKPNGATGGSIFGAFCPVCGAKPEGTMVPVQNAEGGKTEMHEVCYLRGAVQGVAQQKDRLLSALLGIVHKLGGSVRIHQSDIAAGAKDGEGKINFREEPGGFVIAFIGEEKRIVLASAAEMPRKVGQK